VCISVKSEKTCISATRFPLMNDTNREMNDSYSETLRNENEAGEPKEKVKRTILTKSWARPNKEPRDSPTP
jgi:hypothetical protein